MKVVAGTNGDRWTEAEYRQMAEHLCGLPKEVLEHNFLPILAELMKHVPPGPPQYKVGTPAGVV